jgi:hypothetical protein
MKKAQIGIEYIILISFLAFALIVILGIALFYSGNIKDRMKMNQISSFSGKIISNSEEVFYAGSPSKSTISAYLPEGVKEIKIYDKNIFFSIQTNSGINNISFSSKVNLSGTLSASMGVKNIQILAEQDKVIISQV